MPVNSTLPPPPPAPRRVAMLSMHTSPLAPLGGRETGGMNVYVYEVARRLAEHGVLVDVFTRRDNPALPVVTPLGDAAGGARLVQIEAGTVGHIEKEEMTDLTAPFADGVAAFAEREGLRYEVIHSHYWLSVDAGDRLASRWDVPHAAMFHTLGDVKLRARASEHEPEVRLAAERRLVHRLDRVVAATEHERQLLRQIYRVPAERVAVIPLGVDLDQFSPGERIAARAALGIAATERVILAVGRIEPLKGLDILIQSLAAMSASVTGARPAVLYVIGGDERARPEFDRLAEVARQHSVSDRVHFLGARPHEELPAYYRAADVVAVPSFYESFGLVAVEAMACGTPVVASRVGGLASTVADGRTGYLIPWRCPEPFAEKFDLLFANDELRLALGAAARRRMEASYSWSGVADRVAALYDELVAGGAGRHPLAAESHASAS